MDWMSRKRICIHILRDLHECTSDIDKPDEPAYIAAIVEKFPKMFENRLNKEFPHMNFRVGGCFLHQKPIAKFCDPSLPKKGPEIGDLLIVYKRIQNSVVTYNSLLLQAKRLKGADNIYAYPISNNEKHQLLLYTKWPKFIYERAGSNLNGRKRSVIPKTITSGAQYLLIDENKTSCSSHLSPKFWCAMPAETLVASNCFALQLLNFIEFQTGRVFVKSVPRDSWSQMIWDLLNVSFNSVFNKRKYGYENAPRSSDGISEFLNMVKDDMRKIPDSGISVLCIQCEENEESK